jgi:hypothetical protein
MDFAVVGRVAVQTAVERDYAVCSKLQGWSELRAVLATLYHPDP